MSLPLSPHRHKAGDCGELLLRAVEISDGTRDRVTLGEIRQNILVCNILIFIVKFNINQIPLIFEIE